MSKFKQVSKEEFEEYIKQYPNPLEKNVCAIPEPPLLTYNDFKLAEKWPESVVARVKLYDGSEYHFGKTREYQIQDQ